MRIVHEKQVPSENCLSGYISRFMHYRVFYRKVTSLSKASISLESDRIDLGRISIKSTDIIGAIRYKNVGSETLRIIKVFGSCTCFIGSSGAYELSPGQRGEIKV